MNKNIAVLFSSTVVLCLVFMYGCAYVVTEGKDFNSSLRSEITLNKTNKDEVVKMFGTPSKIKTALINGASYEIYYYDYTRGEYPNMPYLKTLEIKFGNGNAQGYELFSTFREDFMTFDQKTIEKVAINRTDASELIKTFGPPHGRTFVVAAILSPKTTGIDDAVEVWSYRGGILNEKKAEFKSLTLYLDSKGIVIKKTIE